MDDIRSLREQRDDLTGKINEVLLRNDSIEDTESIELLEQGEQRLAELDTQIRGLEAKAKIQERLAKPSFGFTPSATSAPREDLSEYRFEIKGNEVRVIGGGSAGSGTSFTGDYGASIPVDLEAQIIRRLPVLAPIRSFFQVRRYSNDIELQRVAQRIAMTTDASTAGGNVTAESAAYTNEDMVLERVRVRNFKTAAKSSVTEEFLRDARGDAVGEMLLQHSEEHGRLWDELYAKGLGSDDAPDPVFLTPTALAAASSDYAAAANTPHADINLRSIDNSDWSTATDAVKAKTITQALTGLRYDAIPAQYWSGMKWMITQEFYAELTALTDAFSRPLFQPFTAATPSNDLGIGTLLGLPVTVTNNVTGEIGDTAETVLAVLAHTEDYGIFDRKGFEQQIDPYSRGDNGEVVFRTRMRSDGRWLRPYAAGMLHTVA